MCDTGACPVENNNNICYFPHVQTLQDAEYQEYYYARLPYSCVSNIDVLNYNEHFYSHSQDVCGLMGNGEWTTWGGDNIGADAYTNQVRTYNYINPNPTPGENGNIYVYGCQVSSCEDPFSGRQYFDFPTSSNAPTECYQNQTIYHYPDENQASLTTVCQRYTMPNSSKPVFHGVPEICCLQNMFCDVGDSSQITDLDEITANLYNPKCFDTNILETFSGGCDPDYRRRTSSNCFSKMNSFCSSGTSVEIGSKWYGNYFIPNFELTPDFLVTNACANTFFSNLFNDGPNDNSHLNSPGQECYSGYLNLLETGDLDTLPNPSVQNARNAQTLLINAATKYISGGGDLAAPLGTPGSSDGFNQFFKDTCTSYPGICSDFLTNYCVSVTDEQLIKNPNLVEICGCYLPSSLTSVYTDTFEINPECTPYCNLPGTIPLPTTVNNFGGKVCQESVCVINNVSLNFINTKIGDQGVNIGNFCGSCNQNISGGNGVCSCILSDLTFVSINSSISSINLSQQCSSGICYTTSIEGGKIIKNPIPCNKGLEEAKSEISVTQKIQTVFQGLSVIGLIVLVIIVLALIYFILSPNIDILGSPNMVIEKDNPFRLYRPYNSIKNVF